MSDIERNKQVVVDYYTTAFAGNPERAIADHFGPRYIQHNPDAQVATLNIAAARAQYQIQRADLFPKISEIGRAHV